MDLDSDQCFYCAQENTYTLDNNEHFWICPQTLAQRRAIKKNAITRLVRWERGNNQKITLDQANNTLDKIGIMHKEYFNMPISRGIITKQKLKLASKQGIDKHLLTYATSCLLIATCQEAWNPRAAHYQKENEDNIKRKEQQEKADRRNKKNQDKQAEAQQKIALQKH